MTISKSKSEVFIPSRLAIPAWTVKPRWRPIAFVCTFGLMTKIMLTLSIMLIACAHVPSSPATPPDPPRIPNRAIAVMLLGADEKTKCFDFGRREGASVADTGLCVYPDGRVLWLSVGATEVKPFQVSPGKQPEAAPAVPVPSSTHDAPPSPAPTPATTKPPIAPTSKAVKP